jgi:hypothetical protein
MVAKWNLISKQFIVDGNLQRMLLGLGDTGLKTKCAWCATSLPMAGHTELIVRVAQTLSQAADRLSRIFTDNNSDEK